MIKRIVKMTFKPENVESFLEIFRHAHPLIEQMPGCHKVELFKQAENPHVMFTLSLWDNTQSLENYRNSTLFAETWVKTKALFGDKPQAWSLSQIK